MLRWYVIECYEGKDFDVELKLAGAGFEVWRPVELIAAKRRQKIGGYERVTNYKKRVARFGRYVFVHVDLTDSVHSAINNQSGVKGFLCEVGSDRPAAIADELIAFYKSGKPEEVVDKNIFMAKDLVRIGVGPFASFHALVERVDSRNVLTVSVSVFGRPTRMIIEAGYVELLERGSKPPKKHGRQGSNQKAA